MRRKAVVKRSLAYMRGAQNDDGGFGQSEGYPSNAQSTAWAIQGIVAAGKSPARFGSKTRSPLAFLASLRGGNGSYRYSRSSAQTPVWVTAQAIAAVRGKALPLRPVPRARRHRARRERVPALGRAEPELARRKSSPDRLMLPRSPRRALEARPVAQTERERDDAGGFGLALPLAAAGTVLLAAAFVLWRRRV